MLRLPSYFSVNGPFNVLKLTKTDNKLSATKKDSGIDN